MNVPCHTCGIILFRNRLGKDRWATCQECSRINKLKHTRAWHIKVALLHLKNGKTDTNRPPALDK